jgi:hypothetical protein
VQSEEKLIDKYFLGFHSCDFIPISGLDCTRMCGEKTSNLLLSSDISHL